MSEPKHTPTTPDATGGLRIKDSSESELSLGHARLQALDLIQAPALETLQITEKAAGTPLHLMIDGLPSLKRLVLPASDRGAVLHLAGQKPPQGLQIEGSVGQIDGDWQSVRFYMEREPSQLPWQRVRVVTPAEVDGLTPGYGLVVVVGDPEDATETLDLREGDDWLLLGMEGLAQLEVDASGRVFVQRAPGLTTIQGNAASTVLDVLDAPVLNRVSGTGQYLSLRQEKPSTCHLAITGNWPEASLRCPDLESLDYPNAQALTLFYCERLKTVELPLGVPTDCYGSVPDSLFNGSRLFMDESTLRRHLTAIEAGNHSQVNSLLRALAHRYRRNEVVTALRSLKALCDAGVDPASVWSARQELLARQLKRGNRKQSLELTRGELQRSEKNWAWNLPEDLAQEALLADLGIWRYCRAHCESAQHYAAVLVSQGRSVTALNALVNHSLQPEADAKDQSVMADALQQTAEPPMGRELSRSREGRALARRLEWLVQTDRVAAPIRKAILELLTTGLSLKMLLAVFERLLAHQPTEIRMRAIRLSQASDQWIEQSFGIGTDPQRLRSTFLQLALRPDPVSETEEAE